MKQHPATLPADELLKHCDEIRTRRSGPGGQHRNKVETAVVLTHRPSGISAEAGERRSQADNRRVAVFRLRINLALQMRSAPDDFAAAESADGGVNSLWLARVHAGRIGINPAHDDFPALLATALDVLASSGWDSVTAAGRLEVTTSQLVRFLKLEPRAFQLLNNSRLERGLRSLH